MKTLKKSISLLLAFCLCLSVISVSARADSTYSMTLADSVSGKDTVSPGQSVTMDLSIGDAAYRGAQVTVSFDDELTLDSIELAEGFVEFPARSDPDGLTSPVTLSVIYASEGGTAAGSFASLAFTVKADATVGEKAVALSNAIVSPADVYENAVTVSAPVGDAVIVAATAAVTTPPTAKTLTFSGSAQELVNAGTASNGTMQYSLDNANWSSDVPNGTNAGSYTVYWRVVGTDNSIGDSGDVSVTIGRKAVTVTANNASKTAGGSDPALTATVTGLVGTDTVEYTLSRASGDAIGTYAITPTGAPTQGNYTVSYVSGTFTISAATPDPGPGPGGGGGGGGGTTTIIEEQTPLADVPIVVELVDKTKDSEYDVTATSDDDGIITITVTDKSGKTVYGVPVVMGIPSLQDGEVVRVIDKETGEQIDLVEKSLVEDGAAYALVNGTCTLEIIWNAKPFTDVSEDDWFASATRFVSSHELFNGFPDGSFQPNTPMDRAMLVTVLYRLENQPDSSLNELLYPDANATAYYADALKWGTENGVITGYDDGLYRPTQSVSRQEMALILYRYMTRIGYDTTGRGDLSSFNDGASTGSWAKEAVEWAIDAGVISGKPGNVIDPTGYATRAEVATMFQRLVTEMVSEVM